MSHELRTPFRYPLLNAFFHVTDPLSSFSSFYGLLGILAETSLNTDQREIGVPAFTAIFRSSLYHSWHSQAVVRTPPEGICPLILPDHGLKEITDHRLHLLVALLTRSLRI